MPKKGRRHFSREFKIEAVKLASQEGVSVAHVARDLGIVETVLRRWRQQYAEKGEHAFGGSGHIAPKDEELVQLKRELARVKRERDFLKSAAVFFAKESE
jgi:transposase